MVNAPNKYNIFNEIFSINFSHHVTDDWEILQQRLLRGDDIEVSPVAKRLFPPSQL